MSDTNTLTVSGDDAKKKSLKKRIQVEQPRFDRSKRSIKESPFFKNEQSSDPWEGLQIKDDKFLDAFKERQKCPKCDKSRQYYCYSCYVPLDCVKNELPFVKLPAKVQIVSQ